MMHVAVSAGPADTARRMTPADTRSAGESDESLMLAYARGDAAAFATLYTRHKGPSFRYFLRHTSERSAAEELHQDVWMKVVAARERYAAEARFTTWLYTLARHRLVDHWRSRRGARFTSLDDEGDDGDGGREDCDPPAERADPFELVIDAQAGLRLQAALAGLPAAQRDAFLLHVEAGLALGEIAALAGVPGETIKSRLRYAYRRLRTVLEDLQ
jgi:RNA polymerase sigma-70 factor (ECF subfamily)